MITLLVADEHTKHRTLSIVDMTNKNTENCPEHFGFCLVWSAHQIQTQNKYQPAIWLQ